MSAVLEGARVSAVNWSEVLKKSLRRDVDVAGMRQEFVEVGVRFEPFTPQQAEVAARLWTQTRRHGLSIADRACLALAMDMALPVMTADRAWGELGVSLEIRMIR